MRILEIFSQGPYSTRATSGNSLSLSRVLSARSHTQRKYQSVKRHTHTQNISFINKRTIITGAYRQTRAPCRGQTLQICSPPEKDTNSLFLVHVCVDMRCSQWFAAYSELVEQQVEDLFSGHGAVYAYVGDRTIGRSKHRSLGRKWEMQKPITKGT